MKAASKGPKSNPEPAVDLARCCAEAQADGVPCPTLGRSCAVCERAVRAEGEDPTPPVDWPMNER